MEKAFNDIITKINEAIKKNPQISEALNDLKRKIEEAQASLRWECQDTTANAKKVAEDIKVSYEVIGQEVTKINESGGLEGDVYNHLKELLSHIDRAVTKCKASLHQCKGQRGAAFGQAMKEHVIKAEKVLMDITAKLEESIRNNPEISEGLKNLKFKLEETKVKLKENNPEMSANIQMVGNHLKATYEVIVKELEKVLQEINKEGGLKDDLSKIIAELHNSIAKLFVETKKSLTLGECQEDAANVKAIKGQGINAENVLNYPIVKSDETIEKNPEVSEALGNLKAQIEESLKKLRESPEVPTSVQKAADDFKGAYESAVNEMEKLYSEKMGKGVHKDDLTKLMKNFVEKVSEAVKEFQEMIEAAVEEIKKKKK